MALIAIIALALALILLPCMIYGFFHRSAVIKRLRISENARQVFDGAKIWNTVKGYYAECIGMVFLLGIGLIGLNLLLGAVGIEPTSTAGHVVDIIYLVICALILLGMALAAGMATGTASVGVWVDPATDRVIYPNDGVSRSFEDLISFRWALGGLVMAEVPLSEVAT